MAAKRNPKEIPFIPLGPFKLRLPFIHYKLEKVEFIQGLIIGVTALSAIAYMTDYMGLPYELAWSCIIIEVLLYTLHALLGDPVIPGWITPTLPLTLAYLSGFQRGTERIQAMIALQLLVAFLFFFMGITKLADKFVEKIPNCIKGGILLAAPVTVMQTLFEENGQLSQFPISILIGGGALIFLSFSPFCREKRKSNKLLDIMVQYGNLFPYLFAMVIGILIKELAYPTFELGTIIKIPQLGEIISSYSIFGVGIPDISMFIKALPLAFICYILAFGDFVTSETLIKEAQQSRDDEYIEFNSSRSNLISGLRNLILGVLAPFPPLAGPLWVGMTVSVGERYKEGKKAMKSLIGGMGSFRLATLLSVIIIPVVSFMKPIFPVGSAITLLFQAYVCARIGMDYCYTNTDKSIAGIMAAVLAFKGSAWALIVGFALNILLSEKGGLKFRKAGKEKSLNREQVKDTTSQQLDAQ